VSAHDAGRRLAAVGPWALDALLALAVTAAGVLVLASILPPGSGGLRTAAASALVVAHCLPIAVRRLFPLPVLAWALAAGLAFASLGFNLVPLGLSILIYVYSVASLCPRRVSLAGLAVTEAMLVLVFVARPRALGDRSTLVVDCVVVAAAWWLGDGTRRRHEAIVAARQRAAELERAREELARSAVVEERLRIARELHDAVAHSMSIIAVQSGVGAHVLDSQPEEAATSTVVVLGITLPWLRAKGVELVIVDADAGSRLLGLTATTALHAVLGVGLGALVRNQVVAVVAGLVWMRVEGMLPDVLHRPRLGRWLPEGAAAALTGPGDATLPMWAGGLLFAAYASPSP
jgi:Histidine kinase